MFTDLCPTCASYYGNRAATYIMLNQHREALEDARQSTKLDENFVKVLAATRGNRISGFPTRSDTNWPVRSQTKGRSLIFCI